MANITDMKLRQKYLDEHKSLRKIAKEFKVSLSTVHYYIKKYEIPLRSKGEAQQQYLVKNPHQMLGKKHTDATKQKISEGVGNFWDKLTSKQRAEYRKLVGNAWRLKWQSLTDAERDQIIEKLNEGNRARAGEGSRFEHFVVRKLRDHGFLVEERTADYTPGAHFEVDIALPNENILIEIDGPAHFKPIYGQDVLDRRRETDKEKNRLLVSAGFNVLRIQDNNGPLSDARFRRILKKIEKIKESHGTRVWHIKAR